MILIFGISRRVKFTSRLTMLARGIISPGSSISASVLMKLAKLPRRCEPSSLTPSSRPRFSSMNSTAKRTNSSPFCSSHASRGRVTMAACRLAIGARNLCRRILKAPRIRLPMFLMKETIFPSLPVGGAAGSLRGGPTTLSNRSKVGEPKKTMSQSEASSKADLSFSSIMVTRELGSSLTRATSSLNSGLSYTCAAPSMISAMATA